MLANQDFGVNNRLMITSWEQLHEALNSDEPLPLICISTRRVPGLIPPTPVPAEKPKDPLRHPVVLSQLNALKHSLRGETRPCVLESLIMESPQTLGSIAASTALHIEEVDQIVEGLTEAGLVQTTASGGIRRVELTLTGEV